MPLLTDEDIKKMEVCIKLSEEDKVRYAGVINQL